MKSSTFYSLNPLKRQLLSFLLLVSAFVLPVSLQAQSDSAVLWAEQFQEDSSSMERKIIASDDSGNVYLTGNFSGTVNFGDTTLTSTGDSDIYVAKVDTSGTILWAESFEATEEFTTCFTRGIATDSAGNIYTTGMFLGTVAFGSITLTSDYSDVFVVKQDAAGTVLWASKFVSQGPNFSTEGIAVDKQGNIYTVGSFGGLTAIFGDITLARYSVGSYPGLLQDTFVVKQNTSGEVLWAKNFGASGNSSHNFVYSRGGIVTDAEDNIYITGEFRLNADFDGVILEGSNVDAFITKMDASGEVIWAKGFGGGSPENLYMSFGLDTTVDAMGNVYITGQFSGDLDIGITTLTSYTVTEQGAQVPIGSIFVLKTDSSGNVLWGKAFIATADANVGFGRGIVADASDNIYVTGSFGSTIDLGTTTLTSEGNADVFVLKMNNSGTVVWAESFGSTGADSGAGVTTGTEEEIYVAGIFQGTVAFGDTTLTAIGNQDVFLMKLSPEENLLVEQNKHEQWKVYPNPVKDILSVEFPTAVQESTLEVLNLLGQKVMEFDLTSGTESLDVSGLRPGVYLLKINDNVIKIKKQ